MPRPIHFEIHPADPERAQAFYRTLFGWQFHVKDLDGNILGIMQADASAQ